MNWRFWRRSPTTETRSAGYTAQIMAARHAWLSGTAGTAELTATVQSCVGLWEHGLALADVAGAQIDRKTLGMMARSLALRGEAVFLIDGDTLTPAVDWELSTRNGRPTAYRLSIPEVGGGVSRTALAAEVVHVMIGADPSAPWAGVAPLRRASLTADLLAALESALGQIYANAPIGSQVVPFPEAPNTDMEAIARSFRGAHGRVLLRESVNVMAAGGPTPQHDWRPGDLSPDLSRSMTAESLTAARQSIAAVFGVLPSLFVDAAQGPLVREAQRHLAQWTLQPIAALISDELSDKLGGDVAIDVMRPLQAFDASGRARAAATIVQALAAAREAGLSETDVTSVFNHVDWSLR